MHQHQVYDTDNHFVIDPITKEIINQSEKMKLMLGDHNSERFTFEIPRYIDGHDMTLCDKIEIHYINIDSKTKESNKDVYIVDDMQLSPNGEDVVIFSWLISGNATQLAGTLNFRATFKCISEPSIIDYQMSTEIFKGITVSDGISNSEAVIEQYSDVLEQWKQELNLAGEYAQQIQQNASKIDELNNDLSESRDYANDVINYEINWNDGGYISKDDGNVHDETGSSYSDYVKVIPGTKLIITNTMTENNEWNAFYDANKTFLSPFSNVTGEVIVPDGAVKMRLSKYSTATITIASNIKSYIDDSIENVEANAKLTDDAIAELKGDLSIIQDRQTPIDGIAFFNDLRIGGVDTTNNELKYISNSYGITLNENIVINVEDGCVFSLSDYSVYRYRYAFAYKNSKNWHMTSTPATSDLIIDGTTGIDRIIPMISKIDNSKITSDDLKNVHVTLYNPNNRMSEIDYVNKLKSFYDTPKELKIIDSNSIISNISEESVIISDDVSLTINNSMGLFNKNIGGNGSITFEDWESTKNISNKADIKKIDIYPYRSMHFPYDGTYANLEAKLPRFEGGTGYPFKEPIGAIYMDTDMNTSLSGLIRILEFKMFGWKNGVWHEISNNNICWCQRYNLPWSGEDIGVGQAYSPKYDNTNSVLINITAGNPLDENHVIHFGCRNVYAEGYDYYIVEYKVKANQNGFGAKVAIDTRNDINGSPTQMMSSRVYALPKNEIVTVMAHIIPDSIFDYVIDGFDNYVPLKLNNIFCAHVAENGFIINMDLISNYVLKIEELQSGHVCIVSNDENGIAIVNENNIVNVNQTSSRLEIVSNKDLYFNAFLSNINAILNYNADLF